MQKRSILAIIPARGGSKGVPRKNVRPLCGRPLIAHTVEAALEALTLHRVIASTDDPEIADAARRAGAEVPFLRPAEYATDTASTLSVVRHALRWLAEREAYIPDAVAVLPPTSPLRTADQIDGTVELLWRSGLDSAVTATEVQNHPYFIYSREESGELREFLPMEEKPLRRQDLPLFFTHSQAVIVSRTQYLDSCPETAPIFNLRSVAGFPIDRESALDIDTPLDLALAEMHLHHRDLAREKVA